MEYITKIEGTKFLACRECKFAILPTRIDYHFSHPPHSLPKDKRRQISSEIELISEIIRTPSELEKTEIISSFPYFFTEIQLYQDGLACQDCLYITRHTQHIRDHYKEDHGWENPRTRGGKQREAIHLPWELNIPCQRFFLTPPQNQYFRVDPKEIYSVNPRPREASPNSEELERESENDENQALITQDRDLGKLYL